MFKTDFMVKPCPICGIGKPRMVHYAVPLKYDPDAWEETEDCLFEPMITYKVVECSNCGASVGAFEISNEAAIQAWNHENENGERSWIFQYIMDEELEVIDNG